MSQRTSPQLLLSRYAKYSRLLGWILFLLAVIVIGVGSAMDSDWGPLVIAIGGSLVPAAVVNAWLDPLLREDAARDMHELLQVREDLVTSGVVEFKRASAFDLSAFVGRTNALICLPINYIEWMNRDYPRVLEIAARQAVQVEVYLPAPADEWCESIAHRIRSDSERVKAELRALPDQLLAAWDAANTHGQSRIDFFFFDGVPSTGITLCDAGVAVEFASAVRDEVVRNPSYVFAFDQTGETFDWALRQAPWTGGSDLPPTSAGMRPLTRAGGSGPPSPGAVGAIRDDAGMGARDTQAVLAPEPSNPAETLATSPEESESRNNDGT